MKAKSKAFDQSRSAPASSDLQGRPAVLGVARPGTPCGERYWSVVLPSKHLRNQPEGQPAWVIERALRHTHASRFNSFSRCSPHSDRYATVMNDPSTRLAHVHGAYPGSPPRPGDDAGGAEPISNGGWRSQIVQKSRITRVTADCKAQAAGGIG
ncbi:hypothetical protein BDN67DRAFT_960600 [Paxillus ammoniavirescens]|nr:hypothetical protein BDN67DRAFT_960600 [Paxillus ammoniavirescens]